ncbi:MAG TPA: hypothetical protein VFP65_02650 [Anaeromyxobacteraceae bacterium]|nr:hypothetical protein [Anaeromyxobacteraceae bacterium]
MSPTPFTVWLEDALSGWILPVAALAALALVGGLYLGGFVGEEAVATLTVVVVGIGAALYLGRAALDASRDRLGRGLALAGALVTAVAVLLPGLRTVRPGEPLFAGDLGQIDDRIPVPAGVDGAVRLLVSGKLADRGEPSVSFTISGTREPVEGRLERTFSTARVGRSGRARVAHDHTADYYPAALPPGAQALRLERVQGDLGSRLRVEVFREPIPLAGGPWILAAVALVLACAAEARLGMKNDVSVWTGMALAFGLLVTYNATPAAAVGPAVGGVILGAITGSIIGWLGSILARKLVSPPQRRPARPNGAAAA